TPRRARPSVADRGDDRADLLGVGVEPLGADRGAGLLLGHRAGHGMVPAEQLDQVSLELERVRLAVIEDAQGDAVERAQARRERPRRGASGCEPPRLMPPGLSRAMLIPEPPSQPQLALQAVARLGLAGEARLKRSSRCRPSRGWGPAGRGATQTQFALQAVAR